MKTVKTVGRIPKPVLDAITIREVHEYGRTRYRIEVVSFDIESNPDSPVAMRCASSGPGLNEITVMMTDEFFREARRSRNRKGEK